MTIDCYAPVAAESRKYNEDNDCTVKAVSITGRVPYSIAHSLLEKYGRKKRRGCHKGTQFKAMKALGFEPVMAICKTERKGMLPRNTWRGIPASNQDTMLINYYPSPHNKRKNMTLGQAHMYSHTKGWRELTKMSKDPNYAIFMYSRCHVSAYRDGRVHDWAADSKKRIEAIVVFKKEDQS